MKLDRRELIKYWSFVPENLVQDNILIPIHLVGLKSTDNLMVSLEPYNESFYYTIGSPTTNGAWNQVHVINIAKRLIREKCRK